MSDDIILRSIGFTPHPSAGRDSIHVAIVPAVAGMSLKAGEHVRYRGSDKTFVVSSTGTIGIVDPYRRTPVIAGDRFWLFLYPGSITGLRHVWSHPDFPEDETPTNTADLDRATDWMARYAISLGVSVETLLDAANDYVTHGEYLCHGPRFEGEYTPDVFWDHYETITGRRVRNDDRGSFFSCSC